MYIDDLKLYAEMRNQLTISPTQIKTSFGLYKCVTINLKKGTLKMNKYIKELTAFSRDQIYRYLGR